MRNSFFIILLIYVFLNINCTVERPEPFSPPIEGDTVKSTNSNGGSIPNSSISVFVFPSTPLERYSNSYIYVFPAGEIPERRGFFPVRSFGYDGTKGISLSLYGYSSNKFYDIYVVIDIDRSGSSGPTSGDRFGYAKFIKGGSQRIVIRVSDYK